MAKRWCYIRPVDKEQPNKGGADFSVLKCVLVAPRDSFPRSERERERYWQGNPIDVSKHSCQTEIVEQPKHEQNLKAISCMATCLYTNTTAGVGYTKR